MTEKCIRLINSIPDINEIELIVVDDYSTEDIGNIKKCISERANSTTLIIKTTEEKGAGNSRNIGVDNSKGKWLLFADSDDYFLGNMWETVKQYIESDYGTVYFPPISRDDITNKELQRHKSYEAMIDAYKEKKDIDHLLRIKYWWDSVCSKLIRRSIFVNNDIIFDNTICSNDVMGSIKSAYYSEKIGVADEPIYCITNRHLSSFTDFEYKETRFKVRINKYIFLRERLDDEDLKRVDLERQLVDFIINHFKKTHNLKETMILWNHFRNYKIKISKKTVIKDITKILA